MKLLEFDPRAQVELDTAVAVSHTRSPRRAIVFRQAIDAALAAIVANPQIAAVVSRAGDRQYVLGRRFPYSIVYVEQPAVIRVIAFAHHKRRSGYWKRRIRRP